MMLVVFHELADGSASVQGKKRPKHTRNAHHHPMICGQAIISPRDCSRLLNGAEQICDFNQLVTGNALDYYRDLT